MNQVPPERRAAIAPDDAIAVVSAYGAFRLLLGLLAVWSFFAGFALLIGALSFGGDALGERVIGAHMIMLAPIYGLLAWRRSAYRLFIWVPYAAQAAIALPGLWELVINQNVGGDDAPVFIVSIIFLVLLVYLWTSSHPLGFFQPATEDDDADDVDVEDDDDLLESESQTLNDASARARRYRRSE
jgi:hypothetical protein